MGSLWGRCWHLLAHGVVRHCYLMCDPSAAILPIPCFLDPASGPKSDPISEPALNHSLLMTENESAVCHPTYFILCLLPISFLRPGNTCTLYLQKTKGGGYSLLRRVVDKVDALLDVALESTKTRLQKLLLLLSDVANRVNSLLGTVWLLQG